MELVVKRFEELTTLELYEILKVRAEVFVVEQNCVYQDLDEKDKQAYLVYLKNEEGIQAYLRVLDAGVSFPEVGIGRVMTLKRRCGLGTQVLKEGIRVAKEKMNADTIKLEAQVYARSLYEKEGFVQTSEEFLEDGIPHIEMTLNML